MCLFREFVWVNIDQVPSQQVHKKHVLQSTSKQPVQHLVTKLHREKPAFRGISVWCGTTTEGIEKVLEKCEWDIVPSRPVLLAPRGVECTTNGITARKYYIIAGGEQITDMISKVGKRANQAAERLNHYFETFDFEAMYANITGTSRVDSMKKLLRRVYGCQARYIPKSMHVNCGYSKQGTVPAVMDVRRSTHDI